MSVPARAVLRPPRSCPCTTQVRRLAFFSPAKAQVQSVTSRTATVAKPPPPPFSVSAPRHDQDTHGLPLTYFDTSGAQWLASNKEHPDPNKAKLGKSKELSDSTGGGQTSNLWCSSPNPTITTTYAPTIAFTTRDPCAQHSTTPFPNDPSPSTHGIRARGI
jgi:hypothetical protein